MWKKYNYIYRCYSLLVKGEGLVTYTIGQVIKKLNINKETIGYYEKIGLLKYTKRDDNGYRIYTEDDKLNNPNMDYLKIILK